ncbi:SpaA isopeptide-forming pilin-related protein [Romboutsia lituseburensis]|uniref:SpaA isopeptide-forming pilin-related protein n=1 Tax=Romboutsia lituseburensis TaxID=1537 RepID=UPI003B50319A
MESKLTDGRGVAQFQLKEGSYTYQEALGLKGYIIDNKEQYFNISNNNVLIEKKSSK